MAVDWYTIVQTLLHPTARRVIELCDQQTRSPRQMADMTGETLGTVSYHVRQLAEKGVLVLVDQQPRRGAIEHYYRTSPAVQKRRARKSSDASSEESSPGKVQDAAQAA